MQPILRADNIAKSFPGVQALRDAHLEVFAGEVHALMGENGAGKSTLMKIVGGVHRAEGGTMLLEGRPYAPRTPHEALQHGVACIHQELCLAENLSVAENVMLGRIPTSAFGFVDRAALRQGAQDACERLGVALPLDARVDTLNVGTRQMVEIARALTVQSKVLIMDEPTAALSHGESEHLFETIRRLREKGTAIIYISHRMDEVFALSDRITAMRDGSTVGTWERGGVTESELIRSMVGRDLAEQYPARRGYQGPAEIVLRVRLQKPHDVSFELSKGEIVGMAGLVGAGRTDIARALIGALRHEGVVEVAGRQVTMRSPVDSKRCGVGYITEDRKSEGLVLGMSVEQNMTLASLAQVSSAGFLRLDACRRLADRFVGLLNVRAPGLDTAVEKLSGGNQQKVLMGRWLARECRVLILDEPTRGVDVGARAEIYRIVNDLADTGLSILLISSDLPELLALSDRVLVVHQGRIAARLDRAEATPERVMECAFSGGGQ